MKIKHPPRDIVIIGFDSAWSDKATGAISGAFFTADHGFEFMKPEPASFGAAASKINELAKVASLCIVAIDQLTIAPNLTGSRPVDRIAGSVIGFAGGGVEPPKTACLVRTHPSGDLRTDSKQKTIHTQRRPPRRADSLSRYSLLLR